MTTVEAINQKLSDLPPRAQEEVLEAVEKISVRYRSDDVPEHENGNDRVHPLTLIAELATDAGVSDLAERHDYYTHGKLEDRNDWRTKLSFSTRHTSWPFSIPAINGIKRLSNGREGFCRE